VTWFGRRRWFCLARVHLTPIQPIPVIALARVFAALAAIASRSIDCACAGHTIVAAMHFRTGLPFIGRPLLMMRHGSLGLTSNGVSALSAQRMAQVRPQHIQDVML
jgi:hypothetical protein